MSKALYRRLHTFKKAYHLAKHHAKNAVNDAYDQRQMEYYKSLAKAWAKSPSELAKVEALVVA